MVPTARQPAEPLQYTLYGVLYHHGKSANGGHYTVDVLDGADAWLHIDDEAVSAVRHEDVFGGHDNDGMDDGCPHMLLYCRTAPTQTMT